MTYADLYAQSMADPEGFWLRAAQEIDWIMAPTRACDFSEAPAARWFPDGQLNTCYNAVDRHVAAGRGDAAALIYDSPVTRTQRAFSYQQLQAEVALLAGGLRNLDVDKGDRVLIYMPMVPEAVFAMLACARIGAVHSVVFGGFAAKEIAVRIDDAEAKVVLTATGGIEPTRQVPYIPLVTEALGLARHRPAAVVCLQRPEIADPLPEAFLDWQSMLDQAAPAPCVTLDSGDPLYILYTSGTTGAPKGIVRENGGHAVALHWTMKHLYDVQAGQTFWAASDIGWVVGHSYIVYAPLLAGCATVLYEGKPVGTPDPGAFWRLIEQHQVRALFTAPTAMRAIKQQDTDGAYLAGRDLSSLKYLFLAGERCDPPTAAWAESLLGVPIVDNWWQTETAWAICSNFMGLDPLPMKPGSPSKPAPGYDVRVLSDEGQPTAAGEIGNLVVKLPLPPSCFGTIWNAHDRYLKTYMTGFPGFYQTGDAGMIDADGYVFVMARTDDVMNVAGHRLSTGALEEVLASHPAVAECAVVGVTDDLKGQLPLGLLVLKAGQTADHVIDECVDLVREKIGPVAAFKLAAVVKRLPKTRSGKILRATIRTLADGGKVSVPPTIDDPAILDEIKHELQTLGYAL